jgi:hypothetical protein
MYWSYPWSKGGSGGAFHDLSDLGGLGDRDM